MFVRNSKKTEVYKYTVLVPRIPSNPQQYLLVRVWLFCQTFLIGILHRQIDGR